jgi:hypothetical protein
MTTFERTAEGLARRIDRRRLLNRVSAAVFGVVAAWAVEGVGGSGALAIACAATSSQCRCNLPNGRSCGKFCSGSLCKGACKFDTSYYSTGCWCTLTCDNGGLGSGYYECCDCTCNGQRRTCGCERFVAVA